MSKTTFEKLGIPYEEMDGILYPVLVAGTEKADIDVGKYGRMWIYSMTVSVSRLSSLSIVSYSSGAFSFAR